MLRDGETTVEAWESVSQVLVDPSGIVAGSTGTFLDDLDEEALILNLQYELTG
jgi:hypothetical protein